jgi:hypothetical protein
MHWATRLFPGYLGDRRRIYLVEFRTAAGELAIFALLAPASTPEPIIAKLHREAVRILALPDVRKRFDELDMVPMAPRPRSSPPLSRRRPRSRLGDTHA